jgi:hypothetical protein
MAAYFPNQEICVLEEALSGEAFQCWDEVANVNYLENYADLQNRDAEKTTGWLVLYEDDYDTKNSLRDCGYTLEYKGEYTLGYDGGHIEVQVYQFY